MDMNLMLVDEDDEHENNNNKVQIHMDYLTDNESIYASEMTEDDCIISLPFIYIGYEDQNVKIDDEITPNLRAIKYKELMELLPIGAKILACTNTEESIVLLQGMTNSIIESINDEYYKAFLSLLEFISNISKSMEVDDDYIDVTQEVLSFDIIRYYKCNETTKILETAEPYTYNGYQLYSQIPDAETQMKVRYETNDTDFNRAQLFLAHCEKILMLRTGYIPNKTVVLTNLTTFYLVLVTKSRPIVGHGYVNLKSNLLSYMCDIVIRSRLMQAWARDPILRKLLMDICKNYDNNNHMVALAKMETPKQRAKYILNLVAQSPEAAQINTLDYDSYEKLIPEFIQTINNKKYYVFDTNYLVSLASSLELLYNFIKVNK